MSVTHVEELTAGFLLGALEPDETEAVRAHTDACARCATALRATRDVLGVLPDSLDEIEALAPRPSVKSDLLAAARADAAGSPLAPARLRAVTPSRIASDSVQLPTWRRYGLYAAAAAAAAAVALVAVGGLATWARVLGDRIDDRDAQISANRGLIDSITASRAVLTMEGTSAAPLVHAALVVDDASVVVLASNVPAAEAGTGYHLWLFDGDAPVYGGLLTPDADGAVTAVVQVDLRRFDRMEVDVQPLGAKAPGGVTVVGGAIAVN